MTIYYNDDSGVGAAMVFFHDAVQFVHQMSGAVTVSYIAATHEQCWSWRDTVATGLIGHI